MGKALIIAEKPSVAKDLARALGGFRQTDGWFEREDAIISCGIGHLVEIGIRKEEDPDDDLARLPAIPAAFELQPVAKTAAQLNLLGRLFKRPDVDVVVNACDAGREGELIFRYIYHYHQCRKPMQRMWFQSMTDDAMTEAWKQRQQGTVFDDLYAAAQCRSEADWIVGINATRAVSVQQELATGERETYSSGRVQTPVLALLVDRERAIRHFKPKDYFEIHGTFAVAAGEYAGKWFDPAFVAGDDENAKADRVMDKARAETIVARCQGKTPTAVEEETKPVSKSAPRLFDLTTLQREANKKFGFPAKRTLDIAQSLYETHKVATYPRTESAYLPEDYVGKATGVVKAFDGHPEYGPHAERIIQGAWVKPTKAIFNNAKISDHFAIIPTGKIPVGLSPDEAKIFDLVVRRFLAVFHPAAESLATVRITRIAGDAFRSTGTVLVSEGWMAVYGRDAEEDDDKPSLVKLAAGETPANEGVRTAALKTKAPLRYTEDTLLAAMEHAGRQVEDEDLREAMSERGLGTPATRAATIEKLLYREYARRDKKNLVPTTRGEELIDLLRGLHLDSLTQAALTGDWEYRLKQMEKGKYKRDRFMSEIGDFTRDIIAKVKAKADATPRAVPSALGAPCPKCGGKVGLNGRLWTCQEGCGLAIWNEAAGRKLSPAEVEMLLRDRETPVLDGFLSKAKKRFKSALQLSGEWKVEFVRETAQSGQKLKARCPVDGCGGEIGDAGQFFGCTACSFKLWKEVSKHVLTQEQVEHLLTEGKVGPFRDFVSSKTKSKFEATLKIDNGGKLTFEFGAREAGAGTSGGEFAGKCPACKAELAESPKTVGCTKCPLKVWKTTSGRVVTKAEIRTLFSKGETPVLKGFVSSKTGKPFDAVLKVVGAEVKFVFPERKA